MRVGIIGTGWFGCHIALELINNGYDVTIFEKKNDLFLGASGNNTGRLHKGFHYPRSKSTRIQTLEGFSEFKNKYPQFLIQKEKNLYGLSDNDSYMDWETYKDIVVASGLDFVEDDPSSLGFTNLSGILHCDEYFINFLKAKDFFSSKLRNVILFNTLVTKVTQNEHSVLVNNKFQFDFVLDCTYGAFSEFSELDINFDVIQLPVFEDVTKLNPFAFVIMDGDFQTLSPYSHKNNNHLYSLYDVVNSKIGQYQSFSEAEIALKQFENNESTYVKNIDQIIHKATYYYPDFSQVFKLKGKIATVRATLNDKTANRVCKTDTDGRIIKVFSGKINSIFSAYKDVSAHVYKFVGVQ